MTETESRLIALWRGDLGAYARSALTIQAKDDALKKLRFSAIQRKMADAYAKQLAETGRVRAIILKARQIGSSTKNMAMLFHDCHLALPSNPVRAYVLAHDDATAKRMLRMAHLFWEHHPAKYRRKLTRANDHELRFSNGSLIEVHTASTARGGRGGSFSRLLSTETAWQSNAESHTLGAFQQVSKEPGTKVVLESTACGATGDFYNRWQQAMAGESAFIPLFFGWHEHEEYQTTPPPEFTLSDVRPDEHTESEVELRDKYLLSNAQLYWRRLKVQEFSEGGADGYAMLRQEYPICPEEAFLGGAGGAFISPTHVQNALKTAALPEMLDLPLVLGVDPAPAHGDASTAVVWRRGRAAYAIERWRGMETVAQAERLYQVFIRDSASRLCIDTSEGTGVAIAEILRARLPGQIVEVVFGAASDRNRRRYHNKKAEIVDELRQWVARPGTHLVKEPHAAGQPTIAEELLTFRRKEGNERQIQLESKAEMRKRGVASPDGAEALATTFAVPDPGTTAHGYIATTEAAPGRPMGGSAPRGRLSAILDRPTGGHYTPSSDYGLD